MLCARVVVLLTRRLIFVSDKFARISATCFYGMNWCSKIVSRFVLCCNAIRHVTAFVTCSCLCCRETKYGSLCGPDIARLGTRNAVCEVRLGLLHLVPFRFTFGDAL